MYVINDTMKAEYGLIRYVGPTGSNHVTPIHNKSEKS